MEMQLRVAWEEALPDYEIPDDDLVGEVLIPAMRVAKEVRVGAGFFSAHCLAQLAPGLAAFLRSDPDRQMRLLLSPEIGPGEQAAIEKGVRSPEEVVEEVVARLFADAEVSTSALVNHTLDCLSYLVATDRIVLRFVLMRRGMYHKKKWLFRDGDDWGAVHGSGNATARGLLVNGEQMTIDRPWMDGESSSRRVGRMVRQWERQWANEHPHSITLTSSQALPFLGRHSSEEEVPTVDDFWHAWEQDAESGLEPPLPPGISIARVGRRLRIPPGLEWETGKYAHQGVAVGRFMESGGRGVLSIATGGGKTRTALIAATEIQNSGHGSMLVVILVPSKPLMQQWSGDVEDFGIYPRLPSRLGKTERRVLLSEVSTALAIEDARTEVLVLSNQLWTTDNYLRDFVAAMPDGIRVMIIGDEMHNLGAPAALQSLPERAEWRLGLSATPVRQFDPDGTDELFGYFGPEVFEFGLAEAIASGCLTPYDYFIHEVELTADEMDKWRELTEALRRAGFAGQDEGQTVVSGKASNNRIDNSRVESLLRQRRAILEQAEGKLSLLRSLLIEVGPSSISRCLIYASAKASILEPTQQILAVNAILADLGIVAHQFTSSETAQSNSQHYLDAFGRGDYQVLTAMKVLDEGVDIPQTEMAFVLASSTVRREWVQRRGRILRISPGKVKASLHDFLVVPPDPDSKDGRSLLKGELLRAEEFSSLAQNEWDSGGPRSVLQRWDDAVWTKG
jgi:superfamily II DNA or RNA helicase